jgi:tripartite-type tricarboxylate transporter receptor subunit TctC
MKQILVGFLLVVCLLPVTFAKETITVLSYTNASGTLMPYLHEIIAKANYIQDTYTFIAVPKPGANGLIAIQTMDQSPANTLALAGTGFTEYEYLGKIKGNNYQPLSALGSPCWVLLSNRGDQKLGISSLQGEKYLTLGSLGNGSVAHLIALMVGQKFGIDIENITFKSSPESGALMAGDGSINMIIDSPAQYKNYKSMNPKIQALGITCSATNPDLPGVKTLASQGVDSPNLWITITANKSMPEDKRKEMAKILNASIQAIGQKEIFEKYTYIVPVFSGISAEDDFKKNQTRMLNTRKKFSDKIVNQ